MRKTNGRRRAREGGREGSRGFDGLIVVLFPHVVPGARRGGGGVDTDRSRGVARKIRSSFPQSQSVIRVGALARPFADEREGTRATREPRCNI